MVLCVSDEEQEDVEKAGPSQTQRCCDEASPNSLSGGTTTAEPHPDLNNTQPSMDCGDLETRNGSPNQTAASCSGDSSEKSTAESEPPAEQPQQLHDTTEEETEEQKQEEACSPSPAANEQPAKRRAVRKRRKSLFSIQAVNSNGTTERGTGEGGSAVSFSCESARTHTPGQMMNRCLK